MKKTLFCACFVTAASLAFAGGKWAADETLVYDGESEIIFTYSGPVGVSAIVYEDGSYIGQLSAGTSKRRIVADGNHTFEVRSAVYDAAKKKTMEDVAGAKKLAIDSRKNRSRVSVSISSSNGRNLITGFSLTNTAAISTRPKPEDTDAVAAPAARNAAKPDDIEGALQRTGRELLRTIPDNSILAIINISSEDAELAQFVIEELEHILVSSRNRSFKIVDRRSLDRIRAEQNFQMSGEVDENSAISIGKFMGANMVITGTISGRDKFRRLRVKALDVSTAEVVASTAEPF
ncbi:MAG: penicillin-binding protein activator LpoB [Treponema sp.]|jgi:hypothetical protein|nr:penicillin-binding protein activator LpoB [Treponema sp.]